MAAAVACSNASEYRGTVCFSQKLSPLGLQRLTRLGLEFAVELFAGIGAARRAAELLQLEVAACAASEIKLSALAVLKMRGQKLLSGLR